ncbi:p49 [Hyphantria cunea granulovirus]|uniref:P49 n=1 Tax=Hyphantria cunea granulovirus TaxID=307448 RepID=A0AAE6D0E8_9BBAC|nr:p49 [Hyphantria cunea granulovirus]QBQ01563.1 p49 [Hyphantria cunea granulovirus]
MSFTRDMLRRLFIHTYFDVDSINIDQNLRDFVNNPHGDNVRLYLNYLAELNLKNIILDTSVAVLTHIKPQFKFICEKNYDVGSYITENVANQRVYIRKSTPIYATNYFVSQVDNAAMDIVRHLDMTNYTNFVAGSNFYITNGAYGVIFESPFVDWCGLELCEALEHYTGTHKFRLYLVGEEVARYFVENDIKPVAGVLKNYHKGTPMLYVPTNSGDVISQELLNTANFEDVFRMFEKEFYAAGGGLSKLNFNEIYFVQRDYIYDADNFDPELLEELQKNYVSQTAVNKVVKRFEQTSVPNVEQRLVIDRYSKNKYKKMLVVKSFQVPASNPFSDKYLFVPQEMLQLRHTLNAAYLQKLGIVILAEHIFFGASRVLDFNPKKDLYVMVRNKELVVSRRDVLYHIGGEFYLEETMFELNNIPLFVLTRIHDSKFRSDKKEYNISPLSALKNGWVKNTLLNLFVL